MKGQCCEGGWCRLTGHTTHWWSVGRPREGERAPGRVGENQERQKSENTTTGIHKGKVQKKNSKKKITNVSFVCVCVGRKWSNVSFFLEFFSPNYSLIDNSLSE